MRFLNTKHAVFLGVVLSGFAVLAAQLPLTHTLGYEFAAITGFLIGLLSGPFVILLTTGSASAASQNNPPSVLRDFVDLVVAQVLLLSLPLVVMTANAWFVPNCSMFTGVLLYLLIPALTVPFSTALACLLATLFRARWALVAYVVVLVLLLLHPLLQIIVNPQLFAYNHIFGVFMGFSWDEAQPRIDLLALYRLSTAAFAALFLCAAALLTARKTRRRVSGFQRNTLSLIFAISATVVVVFIVRSDNCGLSTTRNTLERELSQSHRTRHFEIKAEPGSFTREELAEAGEEHEFRLWQVCGKLGLRWDGTITSYIYPNDVVKRRLLGTESSDIARPWAGEIHLSSDDWRRSLKHELVHVVGSIFGPAPLKVPLYRTYGLTEGLAVAIDWRSGARTPHQDAAGLMALGKLPSARAVMSTQGFISMPPSIAYMAAGSFCKWLMDSRGVEVVKNAYRSDDIETICGSTYKRLEAEWRAFLASVPREMPDSLALLYRYGNPPMARKPCARALTELKRDAQAALEARRYGDALNRFLAMQRMTFSAQAVGGIVEAYFRLGRTDSVLAFARRLFADRARMPSLLPMLLRYGDAAWSAGDSSLADSAYSILVREKPSRELTLEAGIRLAALRAPPVRDAMKAALLRDARLPGADTTAIALLERQLHIHGRGPEGNLLRLTLARLCGRTHSNVRALALLQSADNGPFRMECLLLAGTLACNANEPDYAAACLREALSLARSEAERLDALDRLDRCLWKKSEGIKP
jgi:hypothetical protein